MADGDLWLISAAGNTIDLNGQVYNSVGVQAQPGLTGFGLPPVEVQYQTGAGDGATFRGQRLTVRDIDLPLNIKGNSRSDLRTRVNELAIALSGECRLQWDDGSQLWEAKVRRVGGGEYIYGQDIDGRPELNLTITLRAASPYWISATSVSKIRSGAGTTGAFSISSADLGNTSSYPVVKISGPTLGFKLRRKSTDTTGIVYTGFVGQGTTITVDMAAGTVVNQNGENMYWNLGPNPRFFDIDIQDPALYVEIDVSSSAYTTAVSQHETNFVTNPAFNSTSGWTFAGDYNDTTTQS
jgi:hypothetical protein